MKKLQFFLLMLLIFTAAIAQPPQKFRYQGIARGSNGNPLSNHALSLRVSIHQNNPSGTVRYREVFTGGNTNEFGAFSVSIGGGNPDIGDFSAIQWGNDNFYQEVEMDTTGTGRVRIKGSIEMRPVTRKVLTYIIKEYYQPLDN